jgi:hypothetical protein
LIGVNVVFVEFVVLVVVLLVVLVVVLAVVLVVVLVVIFGGVVGVEIGIPEFNIIEVLGYVIILLEANVLLNIHFQNSNKKYLTNYRWIIYKISTSNPICFYISTLTCMS